MSWLTRAVTLPKDKNSITDVFNVAGFTGHVGATALATALAAYSQTHDWKVILASVLAATLGSAKSYVKIPTIIKL